MKYLIRVRYPKTGNFYFFRTLGEFDGKYYKPISVMSYRKRFAYLFPSIKSACSVISLIDKKYKCVIIPISLVNYNPFQGCYESL